MSMRIALVLVAVIGCALLGASQGSAQFSGEVPEELEGIEILDRSGEMVPGDLAFVDETGKPVLLADYFELDRPLVVQLVYYECPMLCTLVLNGYVQSAKGLDWVPGRDYEVLSVSFDPADTPELAAAKKSNYSTALGGPDVASGWHFLTGEEEQIRALADALGFQYRWIEESQEFSHAAGMFILTPEGKISRTLYGIEFPPRDLRFSLVEAGEGRLGSPLDRLLLYCFQYDPDTHRYTMVARNVMKLGGLVTVVFLGGFMLVQWRRERHGSLAR